MTTIYESVTILEEYPEIYKQDELKKNNKGNISAYEKHNYRISYQIEKQEIYIIRVRQASKEPLKY